MCRMAGYIGPPLRPAELVLKPAHSLYEQSYKPREMTSGVVNADGWGAADATLLRAADELHAGSKISDATWSALAETYDERGLLEIAMLVGHYHLVAFALNSLEVELDDGLEGLPG